MTNRAVKKTAWFASGRTALQQARPGIENLYCCPLCLSGCSEIRDLTFEDVPPKSVGGRPVVLTCLECNNHAGRLLDPHARAGEDAREFAAGRRDIRVTVWDEDIRVAATLRMIEDGLLFTGIENDRSSNPEHHKAFFKKLDSAALSGSSDYSFRMIIRNRHNLWADYLSWLRAAYLISFAALGYNFILRSVFDPLRFQILHPGIRELPKVLGHAPGSPPNARMLAYVFEPKELKSILVQFGDRLLFLPDLTAGTDCFEELARNIPVESQIRFKGVRLPWPTKPEYLLDHRPEMIPTFIAHSLAD